MTHIDTYSHRIPHKYTKIHTFYTHLHTNCHIFGWVTKNHTYIYISIYIYNKINRFIYIHSVLRSPTPQRQQLLIEKKFFNQKTKQTNENQNQIIHSIIDSFIQRLKDSMKSIEIPRIPKSSKNRGTPLGPKNPLFRHFQAFSQPLQKTRFFTIFRPPKPIQNQFKSKKSMKSIEKSNENQKKSIKIQKNSKKDIHS